MNRVKQVWLSIGLVLLGVIIGGYLFRDIQPRSLLAVDRCINCWHLKDVTGLAAAVLVTKTDFMPKVILETDKNIAIEHPNPTAPIHYVIIPKKDIKNSAELGPSDNEFVVDAYAIMGQLVRDNGLKKYRMITNGPGYQDVTLLHFHLQARQ